jgi:16S rRNA processing protein RimM
LIKNEEDFLRIGKIIGTHSLKGRLKIYVISDNINRFSPGKTVILKKDKSTLEHKISEFNPYKKRIYLLKFEGIESIDEAERLKGYELFITVAEAEKSRRELEEGSFYYYDIIGSDAFIDDNLFGTVTEIMEAGSGEILIITDTAGNKQMVPFIESMVNTERIKDKRIDIYPVEGLIDF